MTMTGCFTLSIFFLYWSTDYREEMHDLLMSFDKCSWSFNFGHQQDGKCPLYSWTFVLFLRQPSWFFSMNSLSSYKECQFPLVPAIPCLALHCSHIHAPLCILLVNFYWSALAANCSLILTCITLHILENLVLGYKNSCCECVCMCVLGICFHFS